MGGKTRGQRIVDNLRGRGDFAVSTDELMALMRGGGEEHLDVEASAE